MSFESDGILCRAVKAAIFDAARQFAHQNPAFIAHQLRIDVLVTGRIPGNPLTCMPPLWAKALLPTNG